MAISFQSIKCPSCGANVSGKGYGEQMTCSYCGTTIVADSDSVHSAIKEDVPQQNIHVNQIVYQTPLAPVGQLKTNRGLLKTTLLSLITYGIYAIVVMSSISNDINIVASRYDGKRTMHFCLLLFIVAPITMGIGAVVWFHKVSGRIGHELQRRRIAYSFSAADFWLWCVLGSILAIGPFIYMYKLFKAMNSLCAHYNVNG